MLIRLTTQLGQGGGVDYIILLGTISTATLDYLDKYAVVSFVTRNGIHMNVYYV